MATFASCRTIVLATIVWLSSSIKVYTACSTPTTCSKIGARYRRSSYKHCSSGLSLLESEGTISHAPLLACQPLPLANCHAVCFIMRPPMGGVTDCYFPIHVANGHSSMSMSSSSISATIALCPPSSVPSGLPILPTLSWAQSSSGHQLASL